MNSLLQVFTSPAWAHLVKALLHTLWIGAIFALLLALLLRRSSNPFLRYRLCLAALLAILFGGLISWSTLNQKAKTPTNSAVQTSDANSPQTPIEPVSASIPRKTISTPSSPITPTHSAATDWISWLALLWLTGASLMLLRAAAQVARAESFRRRTQPLTAPSILALVEEARKQLNIFRRIRIVASEQLTSPAVIGILVPTLIFPLSLLTTLPTNQLQLIILHELAHIRRDDYLANLCQLLIEAILFFNPAVWWISHQMRIEREACCDALAINLAPDRAAYARTLAHVAEQCLTTPAPALGFAVEKNPSSLKDRIQRLLIPGYRPSMRLTWTALLGSLLLGSALLIISALGTQWTVHAAAKLLTPEQRIAQIEKNMQELGQPLEPAGKDDLKIPVQVIVKTADGSPLPRQRLGNFTLISGIHHIGSSAVGIDKDGRCTDSLPRGNLYFSAWAEGYAPGGIGPINTRSSNRVEGLELVLERGFPITIHLTDADTHNPIPDTDIAATFYLSSKVGGNIINPIHIKTDAQGKAVLEHCGPLHLVARVEKEGYEIVQKEVETLATNQVLEISTHHAVPITGTVSEKSGQRPISGASLYVLRADNAPNVSGTYPLQPTSPLATTDENGHFQITQLPRTGHYELLVQAEGFKQSIIPNVTAGQTNLQATLEPAVILHGKLIGNLSEFPEYHGKRSLEYQIFYPSRRSSYGQYVALDVRDGVGYFELTNKFAGDLIIKGSGIHPELVMRAGTNLTLEGEARIEMNRLDGTNTDITITLRAPAPMKMRQVVVRFKSPNNISPKGTVFADLPDRTPSHGFQKEVKIQNGEAHFDVIAGRNFALEPAHMVGFWFERLYSITAEDLPGPLVTNIDLIPAGAIYAQARNPDNSPASDVFFSVKEVKRSPSAPPGAPAVPNGDSLGGNEGPRKFVATPLPLDGTYQIMVWRGNNFAVSEFVTLTEDKPDYHVDLQLHEGVSLPGQVLSPSGKPVDSAELSLSCNYNGSGFGAGSFFTDENGRFTAQGCNPKLGQYTLDVHSPGMEAQRMKVNFNKLPITIKLQPGLKLSSRVVEVHSKRPVINAEVRAFDKDGKHPQLATHTDAQGNFTFDQMSPVPYYISVEGDYQSRFPLVQPGKRIPETIEAQLSPGSRLQLGSLTP